jgi:hypothetical protein
MPRETPSISRAAQQFLYAGAVSLKTNPFAMARTPGKDFSLFAKRERCRLQHLNRSGMRSDHASFLRDVIFEFFTVFVDHRFDGHGACIA